MPKRSRSARVPDRCGNNMRKRGPFCSTAERVFRGLRRSPYAARPALRPQYTLTAAGLAAIDAALGRKPDRQTGPYGWRFRVSFSRTYMLSPCPRSCGEVPERSNGAVSKTVVLLAGDRGFESLPLRQLTDTTRLLGCAPPQRRRPKPPPRLLPPDCHRNRFETVAPSRRVSAVHRLAAGTAMLGMLGRVPRGGVGAVGK
jgi:hypothetical protein